MEIILEKILSAVEAFWFKLTTLLNLEEMGTFDSLQPILANILADPILLGLTLAILTIIPYSVHKIKNAYTEKEERLDALLRELDDEDNDETDASKPLFQSKSIENSTFDQSVNKLEDEEYGNEFESQSSQETTVTSEELNLTPEEIFKKRSILDNDFGWESSPEEWDELYDYISKPFRVDKSKKEDETTEIPQEAKTTATSSEEPIQETYEIKDDDFGWESDVDEWDELYDYVSGKPFESEQPNTTSSAEDSPQESDDSPQESREGVPDELIAKEDLALSSEIKEDLLLEGKITAEANEVTEKSSNMGIDELAELIEDEINLDIENTNETLPQREGTTAEIDQAIEETSNIGIEELADLIEEEKLDTAEDKTSITDIPPILEPTQTELKKTSEDFPIPETIPAPPIPQRIELTLEEVEPEHELKPTLQTENPESLEAMTSTTSAGSLLNSMLDSSVSAKTDALVSRLKTFQAELETRFQSIENEPEVIPEAPPSETLRKKQGNYQPAKVSYQSKRKSRSNKEYLRQLESFIFMARQKSKSNNDV